MGGPPSAAEHPGQVQLGDRAARGAGDSAVVWIGLYLFDHDALTIGTLVLFVILIENMFKPTRKIVREWTGSARSTPPSSASARCSTASSRDGLPDAATPRRSTGGDLPVQDVTFSYKLDAEDCRRRSADSGRKVGGTSLLGRAGRGGGSGRPERSREEHGRPAGPTPLRPGRRAGTDRRHRRAHLHAGLVAIQIGVVLQDTSCSRQRRREHRVRPRGRTLEGDRGGGPEKPTPTSSSRPPRGLRDHARRTRADAVRWPAPAHRHRPGLHPHAPS